VGNQLSGATQVVGGCYATVTDKNLNAKTDPCLKWSADMKDKVDTVGIVLKQNNLMANRLDVTGGLTFTRARTDTAVHGGTYIQNPLLTAATGQSAKPAFYYLRATDLPTVTTDTIDFTLRGKYKLDKSSAVHVGYRYQHMKAVNFAYDGMQMTTVVGNTMPTNETAPNYTVHTIGASYIYNF
jgi:methylmalonyl-CoA mutase N-terminal domain/subunit